MDGNDIGTSGDILSLRCETRSQDLNMVASAGQLRLEGGDSLGGRGDNFTGASVPFENKET